MKELLAYYLTTRKKTESLCENLKIEDYIPQASSFVSPPKWHLAHTTWFFEEMILKKHIPNYKVFNNKFSYLFNSYYNAVGARLDRGQRGLITRPDVATVFEYRRYVDQFMTNLLKGDYSNENKELVVLGINHEQQHQELLITDLKYTFSHNPLHPKLNKNYLINDYNQESGWLKIEEGIYKIGHSSDSFCFDNELGHHKVLVESFEISKSLVTNGEFIEFIEQGGYSNQAYWLDEGWSWVSNNKFNCPLYWEKIENQWYHYTLSGLEKVDFNALFCHTSFYEANAYASFKDCRLATEFEWEIASNKINWGKRWEWTNSAYLPYPRYKIKEGAVGEYNGKFMINQMVLRGGSVATSKGHSRNTYRNFFSAETQWQFSGIRLTKQT
jgi:ergothioneine biosynthesis protein EgtB